MPKRKAGQPGIAGWRSHCIFVGHEFGSSQDQQKKTAIGTSLIVFKSKWKLASGTLLTSARAPNLSLRIRTLMPKRKAGQPGIAGWISHRIFVGHQFTVDIYRYSVGTL
jgi:hypothetical protein